ncbi:MAG TPA: M56 family metallopeptidase, partial [Candidatus Eisenbacteria bacterium]|nr:M56 family metallopeptidase [Candidatus Eisenbacteria bacterium]
MTFPAGVLLSSLSASGWGDLLSFLVRATLIAGAGTIVCYQLRKASAAKRHLAAMATLIALIALPIAMAFLPAVPLPILPAVPTPTSFRAETPTAPVDQASGVLLPEHGDVISSGASESTPPSTIPVSSRRSLSEYVILASLAISAALLLRVLVSFAAAALTVRRARRIEDADLEQELDSACRRLGVSRSISLRECPSVAIPSVWGWARPVLLLPVEARQWGRERIRVVFLHEIAHVARHDGVCLLLTRIATSIFWFHPLVWKLARVARRECERCCDDLVLAAGERATDYAAHLLAMVRSMTRPDGFADVAPALAQESNLESRLLSILHPGQRRDSISPSGLVVTIGLAALLLVATTVVQVVAAPAPPVESEIWQQVKQANRDARQQAREVEAALEAAAGAGAEVKLARPKTPATC